MRARVGWIVIAAVVAVALTGAFWRFVPSAGSDRPEKAARGPHHHSRGRAARTGLSRPTGEALHVAGRVTFRGAPFSGATVRLIADSEDALQFTDDPEPVVTGSDGRFDFGSWEGPSFVVSAQADGLGPASEWFDLRLPRTGSLPCEIELALRPCDAAFYGRVTDIAGTPLADACVRLREGPHVHAQPDGSYEICAQPGYAIVTASADGHCAANAHVPSLAGRVRQDFRLTPGHEIVGRVETEDGVPVFGARVSSPGGDGPLSTTTDESGGFRMTDAPPGRHAIVAVADGYASMRPAEAMVIPGQPTPEVVLKIGRTYSISGTVVNNGKPVAGAVVGSVPRLPWGAYAQAISAADGTFVIPRLPIGALTLAVYPYTVVKPKGLRIEGADLEGVVVEIDEMAILRGSVRWKGAAAANVAVWAQGGNTGTDWTDREGRFEIRGLAAGEYRVSAHSDELGAHSREVALTLTEREVREGLLLELEAGVAVSGIVVDERGTPIADARVELQGKRFLDKAVAGTGPDGTFRIDGVRAGVDYVVDVRPTSDGSHPFAPPGGGRLPPIRVPNGTREVGGIRLVVVGALQSISGRVVNERGEGVSHVSVHARPERGDGDWFTDTANAVTVADGTFRIERLTRGAYGLTATAPTGEERQVAGVSAGREDVVIKLEGVGEVEGTLVGFHSAPVVFVEERAVDVSGTTFRIGHVPVGKRRVIASSPAEADSATVEVRAGAVTKVTLTSRGTASIRGRVLEFPGDAPVPGMVCRAGPPESPQHDFGRGSITDTDGSFDLRTAPAGPVVVLCASHASMTHAPARADRTLAPGETTTLELRTARVAEFRTTIGASTRVHGMELVLESVDAGGSADRAGLRVWDVLVSIDGVSSAGLSGIGFLYYVSGRPVGSTIRLVVRRDGHELAADVVVAERTD